MGPFTVYDEVQRGLTTLAGETWNPHRRRVPRLDVGTIDDLSKPRSTRVGFRLQVRPDLIDEYRAHHARRVARDAARHSGAAVGTTTRCSSTTTARLFGYFETTGTLRDAVSGDAERARERALAGVDGPLLRDRRLAGRPADAGARRGLPPPMSCDDVEEYIHMTTNPDVAAGVRDLSIELPSWAFGNSGTRFKVFAQKGVPRDPYEKIADAAQVHAVHGRGAERRAAHPVGPGRRLRRVWPSTPPISACASAPSTPTSSRTTTTCWARSPTRTRGSVARPPTTCWSASTSWTPPGRATSSCGSPTAPTTPARTTSRPVRIGWPTALAEVYASASATTSGSCWSTSCSSRPSTRWTCRTGARRTLTASRSGRRRRW